MRHKLGSAVFAQGWLEGQFENMLSTAKTKENEDPTSLVVATQIQEQWNVVNESLDDLIKENFELKRKLAIIESAFT